MTLPKKSQAAADVVAALLEEAKDPTQSPKRLREIWNSTKSSRVRKAVASNPNSDSKTMTMAARLYIREVFENPSFEILNLFAEDKGVKILYDAYMDGGFPKSLMSIKNISDRTNVSRAILVSPNLTEYSSLQKVCSVLSSAEFSRELKDSDVKVRVTSVARRGIGFYKLPTLIFLQKNGVLTSDELGVAISKMASGESHITNGVYVNSVFRYIDRCKTDNRYRKILLDFVRINYARDVRNLTKEIKKNTKYHTQHHLETFSWLYRELLERDVNKLRRSRQNHMKLYGYHGSHNLSDSVHSHHLSNLMWTLIGQRNGIWKKSVPDIDLVELFNDMKITGFDKDYGPYKCGIKFGKFKSLSERNNMFLKLIELKDEEAFLFFTTCNIFWPEWYSKSDISNPEYNVVRRLDRVNQQRFDQGDTLLYTHSLLDNFPYICVTQSNGLQYDGKKYRADIYPVTP